MGSHLMAAALVALAVLPVDALRTYEGCVGASRGRNQCSPEFDELAGAHREFEDSAADRQACPYRGHEHQRNHWHVGTADVNV